MVIRFHNRNQANDLQKDILHFYSNIIMKKLIYIFSVLCLVLSSCGTTDPWKDLENEGIMGPDRLKPSEVKKILCAPDGWKMTYEGVDFYFQFDESGTVISETNEKILEDKVESYYRLDFDGEKIVLLTLPDAGALKYLPEGVESTLRISAYSENKITATTEQSQKTVILTSVTTTELEANTKAKQDAILDKNKAEFVELLKMELRNGVIRDNDKKFLAHYSISGENMDRIKISVLHNRILTHHESALAISTNDESGILTFDPVLIKDISTTSILFSFKTSKMSTDSQFSVEKNDKVVNFYVSKDFRTFEVNAKEGKEKGDACDELWEQLKWPNFSKLEISDRTIRPLMFCPGTVNPKPQYIGYPTTFRCSENELDRIYFIQGGDPVLVLSGGKPLDTTIKLLVENCGKVLDAWFHEDGWYLIYGENESTLYYISPTTNSWFLAKR